MSKQFGLLIALGALAIVGYNQAPGRAPVPLNVVGQPAPEFAPAPTPAPANYASEQPSVRPTPIVVPGPASTPPNRESSTRQAPRKGPSDAEIAKILISESIASYSGSCPCPYNTDRAGRSCGRRSAYSRPGGQSPLCFETDVTAGLIAAYRTRN